MEQSVPITKNALQAALADLMEMPGLHNPRLEISLVIMLVATAMAGNAFFRTAEPVSKQTACIDVPGARMSVTLTFIRLLANHLIMDDAVFPAMADPSRRAILRLLRAGPRTSGQIAAQFDVAWPTISRHLAILRDAGLVTAERQGQEIYYELNTSVFQDFVQHLMDWAKPASAGRAGRRTSKRVVKPREV